MISLNDYIQTKAFAKQDGLFMGLLWTVTLGCLAVSLHKPEWQPGFIAGFIITPYIAWRMLRNFRDRARGGYISFGHAWGYLSLTMGYASLILAAATLAYFMFIDQGMMLSQLNKTINNPEAKPQLEAMGLSMEEWKAQVEVLSKARPVDMALSFFSNSLVSSVILSLFLAIIGKRTKA